MTYDLGLSPSLVSHTIALKNVQGGSDILASYLSGPDGVVTKPGEPALPLAAVNVTPTDASIVLRGIGFQRRYVDSAPMLPCRVPRRRSCAVCTCRFSPRSSFRANEPQLFRRTGSGGTGCWSRRRSVAPPTLQPGRARSASSRASICAFTTAATSARRRFPKRSSCRVDAQPDAGGVLFTVQVVGDRAAIHQVDHACDGVGTWTSLDLSVRGAAPGGVRRERRLAAMKGRQPGVPANLKFMVQAVTASARRARRQSRAYHGIDTTDTGGNVNALVAPPTTATAGDSVNFTPLTIAAALPGRR
jgi:hypothetical protein